MFYIKIILMYNEIIFNKLKETYIEAVSKRKQDLLLGDDEALNFLQEKYNLMPLNPLRDKILSSIKELIYFDSSLKLSEIEDDESKDNINSHQARIDRKNNRCFNVTDVQILARHFYLLYEILDEDLIYKNILEYLAQCLSCGDYYCFEETMLLDFFNYAIDLYLLNRNKEDLIDKDKSKVILAINKFNLEYTKNFKINMNRIESLNDLDRKIHKIIEDKIKSLGGYKTIKLLFDIMLKDTNNKDFERYIIFRNRRLGGNSTTPIPFQYIIHIACKDLSDYKNNIKISEDDTYLFQEILEDAIAYVDLLEIFEENPLVEINPNPEALPFFIKENILLECLCFPIQYSPKYIMNILQDLYAPFAKTVANLPKMYNCKSYILFVGYILNLPPCSIITTKIISNHLRISASVIKKYLDYFSQENSSINLEYVEAFKETNLYNKPLIKLDNNKYFLLCSQLCAYSFLKIIYEDMETYYTGDNKQNLGKKFGKALEDFVYKLLENKNFDYKKGIYAPKMEQEGECDLILENNDNVVFIEMKNSGIAKEFELGDDVKVLNQLGSSALYAQKQNLKHKLYLVENNDECELYKDVNDATPTYYLSTKDKNIFSVALCGAEALFFTSGLIAKNLISALAYTTFHTKDRGTDSLKKINKTAEDIRSLVEKYVKNFPSITLQDIFHRSTVKSLQQFWFILRLSNNLDEFIKYLIHDTYMLNYSNDFYVNLMQYLKLEK